MIRAVFLAIGLAVAAVPAQASVMQAIYKGTVVNSSNNSNAFGLTGLYSLNNQPYVLTYIYNTALGLSSNTSGVGSATVAVNGGSFYGNIVSPMTAASLTINGVTMTVAGSYVGIISQEFATCHNCSSEVQHTAEDVQDSMGPNAVSNILMASIQTSSANVPLSLTQPYSFSSDANTQLEGGNFSFSTKVNGESTFFVAGMFKVQSVAVSVVGTNVDPSPVPLPASAGLLLAAVGGIGALRLRRRTE